MSFMKKSIKFEEFLACFKISSGMLLETFRFFRLARLVIVSSREGAALSNEYCFESSCS